MIHGFLPRTSAVPVIAHHDASTTDRIPSCMLCDLASLRFIRIEVEWGHLYTYLCNDFLIAVRTAAMGTSAWKHGAAHPSG